MTAVLAVSVPSAAADTIDGRGGNDNLDGGGGADTINGGPGDDDIVDSSASTGGANNGNIIHGDDGADDVRIGVYDTGANLVTNSAYGDAGDDDVRVVYSDDANQQWTGEARPDRCFCTEGRVTMSWASSAIPACSVSTPPPPHRPSTATPATTRCGQRP